MPETIGFVGLGNMGAPMAANLAKVGYRVVAFDVRAEALVEAEAHGMVPAASAREVADQAETVLVSLPTPTIVESALLGDAGIAAGAKVRRIVDMSTSGPRMTRRVSALMTDRKVAWLDAPVSGGVGGARAATLAIMVSGPEADYAEVQPALAYLGKLFFVGAEAGLAQTMKLINNLLAGAALAATAEAMAMGAKCGLAPEVMIEVLNAGSARNTATSDKFPKSVLTGTFDYGFATALMLKDTTLFIEEAEALGLSLRTATAVRQLWLETFQEIGPRDFTTIAQLMEQRAGVSLQAKQAPA